MNYRPKKAPAAPERECPSGDDSTDNPAAPPPPAKLVATEDELAEARLTPKCIAKGYLYADVAQLLSPGGTGKTTQMIYEAVQLALGRPVWGCRVETPGWTLFVTAEDRREQILARLREILKPMELGPEERATVLHSVCVWDVCGEQVKLVRATDGNILLTELADKIVDAYQDDPPIVVVFDPLVSFGASEGMVNDNEQAIVTAARRIVKGLDCCVRVIHHTGKANARDRTLDQYSGRGGSALADGSRMTTVLQTWSGYDGKSQLQPPAGCTPSPRSSITILSRAKLSYSPPGLPLIWIKRTGYTFEHFVAIPVSPEQARAAKADQLERFLTHQISIDRYHNKTSLESECRVMQMSRQELRDALAELQVSGRVVDEDLPKELKHGNRRTYLRPVHVADPFGEIDAEEPVSPPPNSPGLITSPPYRERTGGEITPPVSPPAPCISPQGNGEIRRDWRDGEEAGESEEPELEVLEL